MDGIYIHIPFCVRKCPYCDFYSVKSDENLMDKYTEHIVKLMETTQIKLNADTIYFGGGTPSVLGEKRLSKILNTAKKSFNFTNGEVTLEANPTTLNYDYLKNLREIGFNRLSMGVQSTDDAELNILGRLHNADEAKNAFLNAQKAGFDNISLDLMVGLPNQTKEKAIQNAINLIKLNPQHISVYLLKIETGTAFYNRYKATETFEDNQADIYTAICEIMAENGYNQYEISNFSRKGFESKHNIKYWQLDDYLGIGPSAHSKIGNKRYFIKRNLDEFLLCDNLSNMMIFDDFAGDFEEYIMLGLRLKKGINLTTTEKLYPNTSETLLKNAQDFIKNGFIIYHNNNISLSTKGFLISNYIISRLI